MEFPDLFGVGIDVSSLSDTEDEIALYTLDDNGEEIPAVGITGIDGTPTTTDGKTWRYRFSGRFDPGLVIVRFVAGTWQDNAGNLGVESDGTFNVYSNAASFELIISGAAELYMATEGLKLLTVSGEAKLSVDIGPNGDTGRVQLDLNGRVDLMYFGTIGRGFGAVCVRGQQFRHARSLGCHEGGHQF